MRLRSLLFLAFVFLAGTHLSAAPDAPANTKPQDKILSADSFRFQPRPIELKYLKFLPKGYEADANKKWPLILFLHGAGERGEQVWRASIHGPSKYALEHPEFPFILITPLCPADTTWSNDALLALLNDIESRYQVDKARVYLTGLSMGGYGTWSFGLSYPERFAAMAPICGGGRSIEILLAAKGYAPAKWVALKNMPIWVFHGEKDTVVPISESEHMVNALKTSGVDMTNVKFTRYPNAQHDSWSETYRNPAFYEWLLKHQR